MPRLNFNELNRIHGRDTVDLARRQQTVERQLGLPLRPISAILQGQRATAKTDQGDLTARQLGRRGRYGQAALLLDQQALSETDPEKARIAREVSQTLKTLTAQPQQLEFNFFMANTSVGHQFYDKVLSRLMASELSSAQRGTAMLTLATIIRHLGWQSFVCEKTATELGILLDIDHAQMTRTLNLLEKVGAIVRTKIGRSKQITITPEGAYRGDIRQHAATVERYSAEVVNLQPKSPASAEA